MPADILLTLAWIALVVVLLAVSGSAAVITILLVLALAVGVGFVLPIGGANMPVDTATITRPDT